MYPFLEMPKNLHRYKTGASFKKIMMLYRFDKKLRMLLLNEIEKIEIAVREAVMNVTAEMSGDLALPLWGDGGGFSVPPWKIKNIIGLRLVRLVIIVPPQHTACATKERAY